jgi:acetyl-CoA synthetase
MQEEFDVSTHVFDFDYEKAVQEFRLEIPEKYNFGGEIDRYSDANPDKTAIIWENEAGETRSITYGDLKALSNRIANGLHRLGICRGDKVIVLVPRVIEAYAIYLALNKMGAVIMPGSEMLRAKDIEYRADHAQAKAVIAFGNVRSEVDSIRHKCKSLQFFVLLDGAAEGWISMEELIRDADTVWQVVDTDANELAFLSYTSGTTGGPKGVQHVHAWPYAHLAISATYWFDVREDDIAWATASPGWAKWVWSPFVSILGKGGTAFVYHGRFSANKYLELLEKYPISLLCATPTEYRMMAKVKDLEQYKLRALRSACSAGEPLNREVIETFQRVFNVRVRDGYGQTENSLLVGTFSGMKMKPGSMGRPAPGIRIAIIDEEGKELPVGEVGDIAVHKDTAVLFRGYLHDPERTGKAFRGEWYVTGDQGRWDEEGYIWFEGRADDIIISSGYTIGPFEVEDALVKHPAVAECAAVASPDPERGHIVKAFVVLRQPEFASETLVSELQEHVKKLTAPYKYPREIEFVDSLPKTTSGKIRRVELRMREKERKMG